MRPPRRIHRRRCPRGEFRGRHVLEKKLQFSIYTLHIFSRRRPSRSMESKTSRNSPLLSPPPYFHSFSPPSFQQWQKYFFFQKKTKLKTFSLPPMGNRKKPLVEWQKQQPITPPIQVHRRGELPLWIHFLHQPRRILASRSIVAATAAAVAATRTTSKHKK